MTRNRPCRSEYAPSKGATMAENMPDMSWQTSRNTEVRAEISGSWHCSLSFPSTIGMNEKDGSLVAWSVKYWSQSRSEIRFNFVTMMAPYASVEMRKAGRIQKIYGVLVRVASFNCSGCLTEGLRHLGRCSKSAFDQSCARGGRSSPPSSPPESECLLPSCESKGVSSYGGGGRFERPANAVTDS